MSVPLIHATYKLGLTKGIWPCHPKCLIKDFLRFSELIPIIKLTLKTNLWNAYYFKAMCWMNERCVHVLYFPLATGPWHEVVPKFYQTR